jgi:hypothetical protein
MDWASRISYRCLIAGRYIKKGSESIHSQSMRWQASSSLMNGPKKFSSQSMIVYTVYHIWS